MTGKIKAAFITERMILGHGVDVVIDKIASGLSDYGYDCDIYCNHFDETFKKHKPYNLIKLPNITGSNAFDLEKRVKKLSLILNKHNPDIFLINSFPFYSLAGTLNKPVISINYGIVSTEGMAFKRKLFYKYMNFMQNFYYFKKSARIICISGYLQNMLPPKIRKKSNCIYLGADHYMDAEINEDKIKAFRHKLGIEEDECLLLYVGRLNPVNQPYKGTRELTDLFHKAKQKNSKIRLLMVGFGSKNDEIAIKNEGILAIANAPWEMMP
ncbi:MAG: glycosyltransferase, partial [Actinobacteria bacterium]|nr:glycosyltransferase [Actinomycetota bacterium]